MSKQRLTEQERAVQFEVGKRSHYASHSMDKHRENVQEEVDQFRDIFGESSPPPRSPSEGADIAVSRHRYKSAVRPERYNDAPMKNVDR